MNLCKQLPALALLLAVFPAFAHDLVPAAPQSQPIVIDGATISSPTLSIR